MKWKLFKSAAESIIVLADSFDEALRQARMIDPDFNAGYVIAE